MSSTILDTRAMSWRDFDDAPGVSYKVLRHHAGRRGITLLLRFAAGAAYPAHRHPGGEEFFVLEGSLDDAGDRHAAGSFLYHPPGSVHHPSSQEGCVLLVLLPQHIEPLDAAAGA
jgi:anti-sigma factor ChrR (cupin superfamily)